MHILDKDKNELIDTLLLMLTPEEAKELSDLINSINPNNGDHIHVNNNDCTKEITVLIYTQDNLSYFNDDVTKIITENKS